MAGLPAAAPIAAPAAAPRTMPTAALVTPLWLAACPGVVPACWYAHCRQMASSAWNCSNDLPPPGRTITLGPVGTVAQAPRNGTKISSPIHRLDIFSVLALSLKRINAEAEAAAGRPAASHPDTP